MSKPDELLSFVDFVYQMSGYDFRNYSFASLDRRIGLFQTKYGLKELDQLKAALHSQSHLLRSFIESMTVQVTEMFRDPKFFAAIREKAVEYLKTYPRIKIWHAGCSNGAEVYSMAILLKEAGLLDRSRIYATDLNQDALKQAEAGIYKLADMQQFTRNYQLAGGTNAFTDYYRADNASALMNRDLKKNITFAFHNLATDSVFTEAHLVVCRNVLIYFDKVLQNRVLDLFEKSLVRRGILALGSKESLSFSAVVHHFEPLDKVNKIYRLKS